MFSLAALLAGSGLLWSDDIKPLFIDTDGKVTIGKVLAVGGNAVIDGRVGIGTKTPAAKLDIAGVLLDGTAGRNYFKDKETVWEGLRVGAVLGKNGTGSETGWTEVAGKDGVDLQGGKVTIAEGGNVGLAGNVGIGKPAEGGWPLTIKANGNGDTLSFTNGTGVEYPFERNCARGMELVQRNEYLSS